MPVYELTSPKTGRVYNVDATAELPDDDIDALVNDLDFEAARDAGVQPGVDPAVLQQGPVGSFLQSIPQTFSKVGSGMISGAGRILDKASESLSQATGLPKGGDMFQRMADYGDELSTSADLTFPTNPQNPVAGTIGSGAAQGLSLLAGGLAGKALTGSNVAMTAVPAASGFLSGANQGIQTAEEIGVQSPLAQLGTGMAFGGLEVLTERLGGIGSKAGTEALTRAVRQTAGQMLRSTGKAVGSEALEEVLAGRSQAALTRLIASEDPNNPGFTRTGVNLDALAREIVNLEAMKLEALGGAAGGTVFAGVQALANRQLPNDPTTSPNQTPAPTQPPAPGQPGAPAPMGAGAPGPAAVSPLIGIAQRGGAVDVTLPDDTGELTAEEVQDLEMTNEEGRMTNAVRQPILQGVPDRPQRTARFQESSINEEPIMEGDAITDLRIPRSPEAIAESQRIEAERQQKIATMRMLDARAQGMPLIPDSPSGSRDILDFANENPIYLPPGFSEERNLPEYEKLKEAKLPPYWRQFVASSKRGGNPSDVAQRAFDAGFIDAPTADAYLEAVRGGIEGRQQYRVQFAQRDKALQQEEERVVNFEQSQNKLARKRSTERVDFEDIRVGDAMTIDGEPAVVRNIEYDQDGYLTNVVIEDGKRFGLMQFDPQTRGGILVDEFQPRAQRSQEPAPLMLPSNRLGRGLADMMPGEVPSSRFQVPSFQTLPPAANPDPAQTITGSNVQTGTEMPVPPPTAEAGAGAGAMGSFDIPANEGLSFKENLGAQGWSREQVIVKDQDGAFKIRYWPTKSNLTPDEVVQAKALFQQGQGEYQFNDGTAQAAQPPQATVRPPANDPASSIQQRASSQEPAPLMLPSNRLGRGLADMMPRGVSLSPSLPVSQSPSLPVSPSQSLASAYTTAARGQSSQMIRLADVFAAARQQNPALTPAQFQAQVMAEYEAGSVLLEGAGSPQEAQNAGLRIDGTPVGSAVRMMVPPPSGGMTNGEGRMRNAGAPLQNPASRATTAAMDQEDYRGQHLAPGRDSGDPLHDLKNIYPDDVYSSKAAQYYGHWGDGRDNAAIQVIQAMRGKPNASVKIYRAVPKYATSVNDAEIKQIKADLASKYRLQASAPHLANDSFFQQQISALESQLPSETNAQINSGDWVTTVRSYAEDHGRSALRGSYKIISKTVKAKDIFTNGDSIFEWGYDPESSRAAAGTSPSLPVSQSPSLESPASLAANQSANEAILRNLGLPTAKGSRTWGGKKIQAALRKLAQDERYPATTRRMAQELAARPLDNLLLKIEADARLNWAGLYQPFNNGRGELSLNTRTLGRGELDIGISLVHEVLHHATYHALENPQTAKQKQAKADLEALFKRAKAALAANEQLSEFDYELSDVDEFITGLWTRADFQTALAGIPADAAPTLSQRVRSLLDEIFRVLAELVTGKAVAPGSVLEASMAATLRLMEDGRTEVEFGANAGDPLQNPASRLAARVLPLHQRGEPFRVKQLGARAILTGSPLPADVTQVLAMTENERQAVAQSAAQVGSDLQAAVKAYLDRTGQDERATWDKINAVMEGQPGALTLLTAIDPALGERSRRARNMLDDLSAAVAQTLPTGILRDAIKKNQGSWMRRGYAAFDPESGWNFDGLTKAAKAGRQIGGKDAAKILAAARAYLRSQNPQNGRTVTEWNADIEADMRDLMDRTAWQSANLGGNTLRKNVSSFMRRKDIAPEIRALMGEETNPLHRFVKSAAFQAQIVARHHGQVAVRALGLQTGLFSTQRGGVYTEEIEPSENRWSGLAGVWTTPEMKAALANSSAVNREGTDLGGWLVGTVKALGNEAKLNRVALNPDSWMVNILGNVVGLVQSGDVFAWDFARRLTDARALIKSGKARPGSMQTAAQSALIDAQRAMLARLRGMGVIGSSITLADIEASIPRHLLQWVAEDRARNTGLGAVKGAIVGQAAGRGLGLPGRVVGGVAGGIGGAIAGAQRLQNWQQNVADYVMTGPDALARVTGWLTNYETALAAGQNPDQAAADATTRTLNTFPNYNALPALLRQLSRLGFTGSFIAFQWEVYRNFGWNVKYAIEELSSGNAAIQARGMRRLAGIGSVAALAGGGLAALLGAAGAAASDDEERNKIWRQWFAAPWEKDAVLAFDRYDKEGVSYYNTSYLLPQMTMMELIQGASEGRDPADSASRVVNRLTEQFIAGSVHLQPLLSAFANQDRFGRKITNAKGLEGAAERADEAAQVILEPGFADKITRLTYALRGAEKNGRKFSVEQEMKRLAGIRQVSRTWEELVKRRYSQFTYDYQGVRDDANKILGENLPGAPVRAVKMVNDKVLELEQQLADYERDLRRLGVPEPTIKAAKKDSSLQRLNPVRVRADGRRVEAVTVR